MSLNRQPLRLDEGPTRQLVSCGQYQGWVRQLAANRPGLSPTALQQVHEHLRRDRCAACAQIVVQVLAAPQA